MPRTALLTWKIRKTDGKVVLIHRRKIVAEFYRLSDATPFLQGWFGDDNASISWIRTAR